MLPHLPVRRDGEGETIVYIEKDGKRHYPGPLSRYYVLGILRRGSLSVSERNSKYLNGKCIELNMSSQREMESIPSYRRDLTYFLEIAPLSLILAGTPADMSRRLRGDRGETIIIIAMER